MKILIFLLAVYLSGGIITPAFSSQNIRTYSIPGMGTFNAVEDEILVRFRSDVPGNQRNAKHNQQGATVKRRHHSLGFEKIKVSSGTLERVLDAYRRNPLVEIAEPNYIVSAASLPREYDTLGLMAFYQWGLEKINAHIAWEIETGTGSAVIAIIDSGVEVEHEDLADNIWVNPDPARVYDAIEEVGGASYSIQNDTYGWCFVEQNNNPNPRVIQEWHGTHVAGIAAAVENSIGIVGVSWGNKIMPLRVMEYIYDEDTETGEVTGTSENIIAAIVYAADNGADIINLSLGWGLYSELAEAAVDYAVSQNSLVVAASGNLYIEYIMYPAAFDNAMAVGATEKNDELASFSSYGAQQSISAPGTAILSTYMDDRYSTAGGTSMAAPFVAGAASLAVSYFRRKGISWTPEELRSILESTSNDANAYVYPGWDKFLGHGVLDAGAMMHYISRPTSALPISGETISSNIISFSWNEMKDAEKYQLFISTEEGAGSSVYVEEVLAEEADISLDEGDYFWRVRAVYPNGSTSYWSDIWSVTVDTTPPGEVMISEITEIYSERITLYAEAEDARAGLHSSPFRYGFSGRSDLADEEETAWVSSPYILEGLERGNTYYIRLKARDRVGNISSWTSTQAVTTLDIEIFLDEEYSFSYDEGGYSASVRVSSTAFNTATFGLQNPPTPDQLSMINTANLHLSPGTKTDIISPRSFLIKNFDSTPADYSSLSAGDITLSFSYPESLTRPEEDMLRIVRLNENANRWVILEDAELFRDENRIEISQSSLSVYSLIMLSFDTLADFYIYPNPFVPGDLKFGDAEGGSGIVFANIPPAAKIKIFTSAGELIDEVEHEGGAAKRWEGAKNLSSGVYIGLVSTPGGDTASGKFSVVR